MNIKMILIDLAVTIPITIVVAAGVTYAYSLIAYGSGTVDWATAFQLGIILGIVLPLSRARTAGDRSS